MAYFIEKERKILFETQFSPISIFYIFEKVPAEITVDEKLPYKEEIKIAHKMKGILLEIIMLRLISLN